MNFSRIGHIITFSGHKKTDANTDTLTLRLIDSTSALRENMGTLTALFMFNNPIKKNNKSSQQNHKKNIMGKSIIIAKLDWGKHHCNMYLRNLPTGSKNKKEKGCSFHKMTLKWDTKLLNLC